MKRVFKIIGIILLAVAIGAALLLAALAQKQAAPKKYWDDIHTNAAAEAGYDALGGHEVVSKEFDAPHDDRDKGKNHFVVWFPKEEGSYPLVVMVNGTGVPCNKYKAVFEHIASWGYVVIGNDYGTNWDGKHASESLDFALNTDEVSKMIDPDRIAIGGHSQGGMGAFNAAAEYDNGKKYKAIFSLSPTNQELALGLGWGFEFGTDSQYAYRLGKINVPVLIAAGTGPFDADTVSPLEQMEDEYSEINADKAIFRRGDGVDHASMLYEADGYVIAWLDYYLKNVEENRAVFFGKDAEIGTNTRYQDFKSEEFHG
jgi:predicted dienelactone hydrolase